MNGREAADRSRTFPLDRREFLKGLGAGLLVVLAPGAEWAQESGRASHGHELPKDISAWIAIDADGRVRVFTGKVEVGQNIRTSLAQQVAEELRVPLDSIAMVMGDTDLVPWDMGTFGSRTTPTMGPQLRTMAAAARQMLLDKAAADWKVSASSLQASDGKITDPAHTRSIAYGELTKGQKLVKIVSAEQPLTPAADWKIAGTPVPKANGRDFVTGKHKYPSDIVQPGMWFGAVLRPDAFNARLVSADTSAAEKLPGVKIVRDGDFLAAAAEDASVARAAVKAVKAQWDAPPHQQGNEGLFEYLKNTPEPGEESHPQQTGNVNQALSESEGELKASYTLQYIAHAPLEPRAAVAEWQFGKLTVWTGTQRPFGVQEELMQHFGLPAAQVRVIQPDMGSGYGGKHTGEAAIEAARIAKAIGKPVKVEWTRPEEFTWAYLRPAGLIEIRAAARRPDKILGWEHHNYNSGPSAIETPYDIPNQFIQYHPAKTPLRQGSYRALAATANNFARESHMDALAHSLSIDPLEFRLKNLTNPRLRAVLQAATDKFAWAQSKSTPQRGYGLACGTDKGGYTAACAEVEIGSDKSIRVRRVVAAWESGAVVNPDGLRNQQMGAIVQALGGALFEHIVFGDGRIRNPYFSAYRLPRFADTPQIEIVLLDRKDLPSAGAGEIGLIALAPAVGNAIFAATGVHLRNLPMAPDAPVPGIEPSPFRA